MKATCLQIFEKVLVMENQDDLFAENSSNNESFHGFPYEELAEDVEWFTIFMMAAGCVYCSARK